MAEEEHIPITNDQQWSKVGKNSSVIDHVQMSSHHVSITKPKTWQSSETLLCVPHSRVTQQAPSWLPVLEKHDIPIVVGVGVSLAFIFITVSFYSVVQKNGPAPTSRAGQKFLSPPNVRTSMSHSELIHQEIESVLILSHILPFLYAPLASYSDEYGTLWHKNPLG